MSKKTIYFRHQKLRINFDGQIVQNSLLCEKYMFIEDIDMGNISWSFSPEDIDLALVWGAHKKGADAFIQYCIKKGIPYIIVERSPLLKNGKRSLYFDYYGTTYNSEIGDSDFWHKRAASILRQIYIHKVVGVGRLRTL